MNFTTFLTFINNLISISIFFYRNWFQKSMTFVFPIPWININVFRIQAIWTMISSSITRFFNIVTTIFADKIFINHIKSLHKHHHL